MSFSFSNFFLLVSIALTAAIPKVWAFSIDPVPPRHDVCGRPITRIFANLQKNNQDGGTRRPSNEFSRTVPPDKVLKLHGKHQRSQASSSMAQRQYSVDIKASSEECAALATRFQLPGIDNLDASLSLSPEGTSGLENSKGVVVEGTVHATVTRTCVRSNEKFKVDMEFPIFSIVRPVQGFGPISTTTDIDLSNVRLNRSKRSTKKVDQQSNNKDEYDENTIDPMELLKMQAILENIEQHGEYDEDVLMEDESIYATNGMLDVGELVSQLFWLKLDPYPKKPGSEFFQFSITG